MITKHFQKGDAVSSAEYSDCLSYRYSLTRVWQENQKRALFIMLNPSTATERQNDPTVERCEQRARVLGFGAFQVCNIFAWRETDPRKMRRVKDPVGPENDAVILASCAWSDQIICAWGTHGAHLNRGENLLQLLHNAGHELWHLGLTKQGYPRHPLYIAYTQHPILWQNQAITNIR